MVEMGVLRGWAGPAAGGMPAGRRQVGAEDEHVGEETPATWRCGVPLGIPVAGEGCPITAHNGTTPLAVPRRVRRGREGRGRAGLPPYA